MGKLGVNISHKSVRVLFYSCFFRGLRIHVLTFTACLFTHLPPVDGACHFTDGSTSCIATHDKDTFYTHMILNAQFSGDSAFDAEGGGLLQDQEEAEQAQEDRLDDGVFGRTGAVAAADDANTLFEGTDTRAVREGFGKHVQILELHFRAESWCVLYHEMHISCLNPGARRARTFSFSVHSI